MDTTVPIPGSITERFEQFVNPRIFPMRHDKGVMTNQAEFVDDWN